MPDDDLQAELDAYLDELDVGAVVPIEHPDGLLRVDVSDERAANGLLRKRERLLQERERIVELVDGEIEKLRAFARDRMSGIHHQLDWIERSLEHFTRETLPAMKRSTLVLPAGTLKLTKPGAPSFVIDDVPAFVNWCRVSHREELIALRYDIDKAMAKQFLQPGSRLDEHSDDERESLQVLDGGEVVPGVRFTRPARPRFNVTRPAQNHESSTQPQGDEI